MLEKTATETQPTLVTGRGNKDVPRTPILKSRDGERDAKTLNITQGSYNKTNE